MEATWRHSNLGSRPGHPQACECLHVYSICRHLSALYNSHIQMYTLAKPLFRMQTAICIVWPTCTNSCCVCKFSPIFNSVMRHLIVASVCSFYHFQLPPPPPTQQPFLWCLVFVMLRAISVIWKHAQEQLYDLDTPIPNSYLLVPVSIGCPSQIQMPGGCSSPCTPLTLSQATLFIVPAELPWCRQKTPVVLPLAYF